MREEKLLAYLKGACVGRAYRVSGAELGRTLDISGTHLRKLVNRLRQNRRPICSDRSGYFYAATAGEVYATIRQLRRMVDGLEAAIHGLEGALEDFTAEGSGSG